MTLSLHSASLRASGSVPVLGLLLAAATGPAAADETCQSPYMRKSPATKSSSTSGRSVSTASATARTRW
jgi:hypothetical protein